MKEKQKEKEAFKNRCYEAHKMLWMIRHGISMTSLREKQAKYAVRELREYPIDDQSNAEYVTAFMDSLADYVWQELNDNGDYPEIKSFFEKEFLDPDYMAHLFTLMPGDKEESMSKWSRITGIVPSRYSEKLEAETPAGVIRAYKNLGPERPGITVMLQPKGYEDEIDAAEVCTYTDPEEDVSATDVIIHVWNDTADPTCSCTKVLRREDVCYALSSVCEQAWEVKGHGFLHLQSCDEGWDYTLYGPDYKGIDGGVIEDNCSSPIEIRDQILENQGWSGDIKEVDAEDLLEKAE